MADFGIYMMLVNNSSYTIVISYDAENGKSATNTGTLFSGGKTSIMYAEDPSGPQGAEGTFTFTLKEPEKDNVVKIYVDCPYSGENKFEIKQTSQFLNLSQIRFANTNDNLNGGENWGNNELPKSGHPLAIQITVEDSPISSKLSVMTYNTHLFEGSPANTVGSALHVSPIFHRDYPVVYKDDERAAQIVHKIKENPPDIVCLQEVWSNDMRNKILSDLGDTYPYVYLVPDKGTDLGLIGYAPVGLIGFLIPFGPFGAISNGLLGSGLSGLTGTFTLNGLIDKVLNTSGLLLLSQYPLSNFDFTMYTDLSGDDNFAKKGICTCDVTMPINRNSLHTFRLGFTHAPVKVSEAQKAIAIAVKQTMDGFGTDKILAGDFNIHQQTATEYDELNKTMESFNATDVISKFIPDINESYTDFKANELTVKFFGSNGEGKDRIDYIYFSPGSQNNHLQPDGAEVIHDWNLSDDNLPLSDHYPVKAYFKIIN